MGKNRKGIVSLVVALLVTSLLVVAPAVQGVPIADVTYYLTSDHATGGLGTPPFGTVELFTIGSGVQIEVDLNPGYLFVLTGSSDFMDFKFNATGVTTADITVTQNAVYTLAAQTGTFNGDGTGNFAFGITGTNQPNGAGGGFATPIIFTVANASIADLTNPNSLGILFVADLYSSSTGNTGPADVTGTGTPGSPVPEPATMLLLGSGLIGLWGLRRKFKS